MQFSDLLLRYNKRFCCKISHTTNFYVDPLHLFFIIIIIFTTPWGCASQRHGHQAYFTRYSEFVILLNAVRICLCVFFLCALMATNKLQRHILKSYIDAILYATHQTKSPMRKSVCMRIGRELMVQPYLLRGYLMC